MKKLEQDGGISFPTQIIPPEAPCTQNAPQPFPDKPAIVSDLNTAQLQVPGRNGTAESNQSPMTSPNYEMQTFGGNRPQTVDHRTVKGEEEERLERGADAVPE